MALTRIAFELRGIAGLVTVDYGVNEGPQAWGFELLGLSYGIETARGCPVLRASVDHPAEGYSATVGRIQIIRYGGTEIETSIVDAPPQLADARIPWAFWGVRPTFFDAPSTSEREFKFRADTFLAFSPDAVISRQVRPLCGFSWGYDVHQKEPSLVPLTVDDFTRWAAARVVLERHCPGWRFLQHLDAY